MIYNYSLLFATSLNKLRNRHAAVLISKYSLTNHRSVQLLADKRCRWLTHWCHLLRLMRKKRRKKKLNKNRTFFHKKNSDSFSTIFQHYYIRTTQPVINNSINNISHFCDRCNDCKVIKLFKKRRKYSESI